MRQRLGQERNAKYSIAEYNAYQAARAETNKQAQTKQLYEFVTRFPHSALLPYINQLYILACSDSENQQPGEQRAGQSKSEPTEERRWAMFAGNTWPGQDGLAKLAQLCGAPPANLTPDSIETILVESVATDLASVRATWGMTQQVFIVPLGSPIINAWTRNSSSGGIGERNVALICLPTGTVKMLQDSAVELEALIAHEMGHAVDRECYNYGSRTRLGQTSCEARADAYAFAFLTAKNRNPYAVAGMFGRLEMFYGDVSTGILARLTNVLGGNHPITPDRIKNMRNLLVQYQKTHQSSLPPAVP